MLLALIILLLAVRALCAFHHVSHVFLFPSIPYSAGIHHIHSPAHFMEAHGFALPGFQILETRAPQSMGNYVTAEFFFRTHFHGRRSGKVFSSSLNTSHVLVMDQDEIPCLLGRLSIGRCASNGHMIRGHADLLRPASVWERMFGGERMVRQCEVERAIKLGYSDLKGDMNLKQYLNTVMECANKKKKAPGSD
jgi:hypothetical protein